MEYWSPDLQTGWVVATHRLPLNKMVVRELKPDSAYVFLVRAENAHGFSPASAVSSIARTLSNSRSVPLSELDAARSILSTKIVELHDALAYTSTSIKLQWKLSYTNFMEGVYIRFRELSGGTHNYNILTVLDFQSHNYSVNNLKKYTKYEFFISPFYKSLEGQPSNSRICKTLEDIPSAPPDSVSAGLFNNTVGWVKWLPPPPQHHNGIIIGYKLQIKGSASRSLTINSSTTSVLVSNLTINGIYSVRVAALTQVGLGPFSNLVPLLPSSRAQSPRTLGPLVPVIGQTWFVLLSTIIILLLLTITSSVIYVKRKRTLKKQLGHLNVPVVNVNELNTKETLWIDKGWRPSDGDKDSVIPLTPPPADYAEVETKSMSTFYNCIKLSDNPTPYATTMIIPTPTWAELIPPPPDHPPPQCPRETVSLLTVGNESNYESGSAGYACYAIHAPDSSLIKKKQFLHYSKPDTHHNCGSHCSLSSDSEEKHSTYKNQCRHFHSCDNKSYKTVNFNEEHSYSGCHNTTSSCGGESSCSSIEAGLCAPVLKTALSEVN